MTTKIVFFLIATLTHKRSDILGSKLMNHGAGVTKRFAAVIYEYS